MRNRKIVKGGRFLLRRGGFLESIIPAAINFATNTNSAVNVGSLVKDAVTTGMHIKDTVNNVKKIKAKEDIRKLKAIELLNDLYS